MDPNTGASQALLSDSIATHLAERSGQVVEADRLGGLSGASVLRLHFESTTAILKHPASVIEHHVYTQLSGLFHAHGVHIPRLLDHGIAAGIGWLLIEDIPTPLPVERHLADPGLLAMLRRLHRIKLDPALIPDNHYRPGWKETLTATALEHFPASTVVKLRPALDQLRDRARPLFDPTTLISGDPNPRNWGLRSDGKLILFDWERLTLATPALDLAITAPGLPTATDLERVARGYLGAAPEHRIESLVTDLWAAKAWTIIEFLAELTPASDTPSAELDWLCAHFPDWLRTAPR